MKEQGEQEGDGLIEWILERRPRPVKNFLKIHGNKKIQSMQVCRVPLSKNISKIANWITRGKYSERMKKLRYNQMFHLYLIFRFEGDNQIYTIEKNERVGIKRGFNKDGECRVVNIPTNKMPSLESLIVNAERNGLKYQYSVHEKNCQDFLVKLLGSSKLLTIPMRKFILQDIKQILPERTLQRVSKGLTNVAGIFDFIRHGGGSGIQKGVDVSTLRLRAYLTR